MQKKVLIGIVGISVLAAGWFVYIKYIRDRNKRVIKEGSFEIVIDDSYKTD
jgi:uncharacterized membrane protein YukC